MKKTLLTLAVVAALAAGQNAYADVLVLPDSANVWTGWNVMPYNDTNGLPQIGSTVVTTDGFNLLGVGFVFNSKFDGVDSGDLFLDRDANGTWDYFVQSLWLPLDAGTSKPVGLYAINVALGNSADGSADYILANVGRVGHPIGLVNTVEKQFIRNINYSISADGYKVDYDFSGLTGNTLSFDKDFIIGYAVSCANDVVYQQVPVPEPATFVMLGAGLLGLGLYGRRKKQL